MFYAELDRPRESEQEHLIYIANSAWRLIGGILREETFISFFLSFWDSGYVENEKIQDNLLIYILQKKICIEAQHNPI